MRRERDQNLTRIGGGVGNRDKMDGLMIMHHVKLGSRIFIFDHYPRLD